jgi:hypothetical protein
MNRLQRTRRGARRFARATLTLAVVAWPAAAAHAATPKEEVTTSNSPSANGSACTSAGTQSSVTLCAAASRRPGSKFSGVRSQATTSAPASAARIAVLPVPAAASSTRWPADISQARTSSSPSSQIVRFANVW